MKNKTFLKIASLLLITLSAIIFLHTKNEDVSGLFFVAGFWSGFFSLLDE